jgi:hypothetical protein
LPDPAGHTDALTGAVIRTGRHPQFRAVLVIDFAALWTGVWGSGGQRCASLCTAVGITVDGIAPEAATHVVTCCDGHTRLWGAEIGRIPTGDAAAIGT